MLCVATHRPLKPPQSQKMKTWKFAAKFVWKNNFVKDKAELGSWTRDQLLELGPTFVKLGQIASTRADLYPPNSQNSWSLYKTMFLQWHMMLYKML